MAKAAEGSIRSVLSLANVAEAQVGQLDDARRKLLADWCRLVGDRLSGKAPPAESPASAQSLARLPLTPRMRDILDRLLVGDSEKQIARHLGISPHTVHTHVKKLHKSLNVSSRGELLARFVQSR